jgi:hypothetical protein
MVTEDAPTAVTVPELPSAPPWSGNPGRTADAAPPELATVAGVVVAFALTTPQVMAAPAATPATAPRTAMPARPRGDGSGGGGCTQLLSVILSNLLSRRIGGGPCGCHRRICSGGQGQHPQVI